MNIKTLTKKILMFWSSLKQKYLGRIDAERDWGTLLIFSLVILLISAAMNGVFFMRVYDGAPLSVNVDTNPPLKETQEISDRLEKISAFFVEREVKKEAAINTPYPFVDPARN